ncbi:aminotransferase class I/II-fold pyridoxal phosphate-dependent enzyme [Aggregicoccus sp. 17bor-14]|uniref:aminotransferase class I/II-fold pyridoxal phosphate-dependent enzyme n=1 Tax=Myxococcaceae TaxID=31 RepID=UPI00129C9B46|nr:MULTISPECIES: aminotransferase class I/II-fold pyridoxal phosphate-dependent enzyme [Myxococcaceae]MBF5043081.1 aminotransferase class I/II-fold pyridoxal phosphate-dependent enzyme [Simulacricoccus sp. 17bor-14]MRI88844.1 aminotransferase class I/II-fold pyridoxal phosphate-dependent enzyme [Aggregicoccus sp. 17bor-14]
MTRLPQSPRDAFLLLQQLDQRLQRAAPGEERDAALEALRALAEAARGAPEGAPLRLATVVVAVGASQERLELLLLPSIFAPEAWAYTFLEGLLKVPLDEYAGKRLVEVGSGSGWICIALARFTALSRVHGVDLNPQAPVVARLNAWLNGDAALVERLSFAQSDLLRDVSVSEGWDFVVGCIPQVLRSEGLPPALAPGLDALAPDAHDAQALYDLSNYCAVQNVYEDHFGLGLIARLLDEAPERLAPGGRLLLNLAGRPGHRIIERMFSRRGFRTHVQVARRVMQAADTDIRPLVALEQRTGREFEFFMQAHSAEPIRAATALGWLAAGNPIWHEVAVWEARPALPREALALRRALRALGLESLLAELDLAHAGQEQLSFVAALAERLAHAPVAPYAHESGDASFRRLIARYLERFFDLRLREDEVFVAPEREQAVYALLLATCDAGDEVLVSRNVQGVYARALEKAGVHVTVTHNTLSEIKRLLTAFPVKLVLLSVEPSERTNLAALRDILAEAARRGIRVVLDESPFFNITSGVEPRTLFEFLAREPSPHANLVVLYGLIKNAVYPDLELTLLLPVGEQLRQDLEVVAEVTYSRVSTLAQWFYERTFADLLSFRISFGPAPEVPPRAEPAVPLPRSQRIARLAGAPAFAPRVFREDDPERVRLDYGENEGPLPAPLVSGLVAALAAPHEPEAGHGLAEGVAAFLLETRGLRYAPRELVLAQGVWPLVHDLGVALARQLGRSPRVFLAAPCYGVLPPTLEAAGCEVEVGPLEALYARRGGSAGARAADVVVVSQPANPAGTYLTHEELVELATWVVGQGAWLVSDEIFGLVNLSNRAADTVMSPVTVEQVVPGIGARTLVLGGLSKEFAAGGLRVGWLAARDARLLARVQEATLGRLHLATARAAAHLYGAWARGGDGRLLHPERHRAVREFLTRMRAELADKRALLAAALPAQAPDEAREAGGLFLAPRMDAWLGKQVDGVRLTPENLPAQVYAHTHVVLNGGAWCSDPQRVRAVFSIPRAPLERAAAALRAFAQKLRD